jgi:hypothetical protein
MGKSKSKIVDLIVGEDGSYTPKRSTKEKNGAVPCRVKISDVGKTNKPKYMLENNADHFLGGLDVGLDFLDNVVPRVERFLKLRG